MRRFQPPLRVKKGIGYRLQGTDYSLSPVTCHLSPITCHLSSNPNTQIRAILSLPVKIVAIVTEIIWQSES